jgi:hypothetical protein
MIGIQDVSIVFGTRENEDAYGKIVKLDMGGNLRWQFPVTSSIDSEPVEGNNGEVYVATVDGRVFAVQVHFGKSLLAVDLLLNLVHCRLMDNFCGNI